MPQIEINEQTTAYIAFALLVILVIIRIAHRMRQVRIREQVLKKPIAEHRMAARYIQKDPEDIEDAAPHVYRGRWMMIGTTAVIIIYVLFAFFFAE